MRYKNKAARLAAKGKGVQKPKRSPKAEKAAAPAEDAEATAARLAAEAAAAEAARAKKSAAALAYVRGWAARGTAPWRFNKTLQQWWLDSWGDAATVSKGDFAIFIDYAATIAGGARARLAAEAATAAAHEGEDSIIKKKRIRAKKLARALEAAAPAR